MQYWYNIGTSYKAKKSKLKYEVGVDMEQPVKIIYSKRLAEFLLLHNECVLVKVIPHPYKDGFNAWVFIDDEELHKLMTEYTEQVHK